MMTTHARMLAGLLAISVTGVCSCRSPEPIERPDTGTPDAADFGTLPDVVFDHGGAGDPGILDPGESDVAATDSAVLEEASDTAIDPDVTWNPIARTCVVTVSYKPAGAIASVTVPGEWNGWDLTAHPMNDDDKDGTWKVEIGPGTIPAGEYGYKLVVDGTNWNMDPANPLVKYVDSIENSKLVVPDCELPALELLSAKADWAAKTVEVNVQVYTGVSGQDLVKDSVKVESNGKVLEGTWFDPATQQFKVRLTGLARGKYSFTFSASNANGAAEPLFVPLWLEEKAFAWTDAILYFAMTDRFANGDTANDSPSSCLDTGNKANWLGGDFAGLKQKIEEGYFDGLGVNSIWISAANQNPDGCYKGDLSLNYTAYHGYFPTALDEVENHFGTLDDFRAMVKAAHDRGIRVLMDLAANHVHEDSPLWASQKDWFNATPLMCGDADNWNDHPVDCWFQHYLPDLNFKVNDATNAFTDAAIWWAREADLDGFRVDAVKHLDPVHGQHNFTQTLKWKLQRRIETTGIPFYLVGETFVGGWGDWNEKLQQKAEDTIKSYVADTQLHGQFNFPLYWEIVGAFARGEIDMGKPADVLAGSLAFYGSNSIMSNFLGNHDIARFISHANGDIQDKWSNGAKELGWSNPPPVPAVAAPFSKLRMAFAFLMTVPGIPLVYYGDEVGLPGAGDPDNRRMMQFDGLSAEQQAIKEDVAKLAKARLMHPAMRTGSFSKLMSDANGLAIAVSGSGDAAVAVFNRGDARTFSIPLAGVSGLSATQLTDVLTGKTFPVSGGSVSVDVPALGAVVLVP